MGEAYRALSDETMQEYKDKADEMKAKFVEEHGEEALKYRKPKKKNKKTSATEGNEKMSAAKEADQSYFDYRMSNTNTHGDQYDQFLQWLNTGKHDADSSIPCSEEGCTNTAIVNAGSIGHLCEAHVSVLRMRVQLMQQQEQMAQQQLIAMRAQYQLQMAAQQQMQQRMMMMNPQMQMMMTMMNEQMSGGSRGVCYYDNVDLLQAARSRWLTVSSPMVEVCRV